MMEDDTPLLTCIGSGCDWEVTGNTPGCIKGSSSCTNAKLLVAELSDFHDQTLATVTAQINALLETISPDPAGRKLSFMHSRLGTFLGWVEHGVADAATNGAVNAASDDAAIIQALNLVL